jgi:pSer/pThr/pTyr-binding forkhead associated (FHA) protein
MRPCPSCNSPVPASFLFCGKCGFRMSLSPGAAGATPSPAGGVRTAQMVPAPRREGKLVLIRSDGSEAGAHTFFEGTTLIGRGHGDLFDADVFLSPRHAELSFLPDRASIRDLGALNGVFMKMRDEEEIETGTVFRIGQELLRFDAIPQPQPLPDGTEIMGSPNPGFWGRLTLIIGQDVDGSAFPLFGDGTVLGRERGDIQFPEDLYVSGTHARVSMRGDKFYLADLGSSNGTFIRIRSERPVIPGTMLLMGQQLFKVQF